MQNCLSPPSAATRRRRRRRIVCLWFLLRNKISERVPGTPKMPVAVAPCPCASSSQDLRRPFLWGPQGESMKGNGRGGEGGLSYKSTERNALN